jgi:hypothetical protein
VQIRWFDDLGRVLLEGYRETWDEIKPEVEEVTQRVLREHEAFFLAPLPPGQESGLFGLGFTYGPIHLTHTKTGKATALDRFVSFKKEYPHRALVLFGGAVVGIVDFD